MGAGAGVLGVVALGSELTPAEAAVPAGALVRSHYSRSVGGVFTAVGPAGNYRLRLVRIRELEPVIAAQREDRFNLIFRPVGRAQVPDGIYSLRRPGVATHALFVSSTGPAAPQYLQALVNRSTG
jgi:hypothetical protein